MENRLAPRAKLTDYQQAGGQEVGVSSLINEIRQEGSGKDLQITQTGNSSPRTPESWTGPHPLVLDPNVQ